MTKNVGTLDKTVRIATAALLATSVALGWVSGTLAWVLGAGAVALVATSLTSFCGLYTILGINTCKVAR